jgi:hypothetical protein
MKEARGLMNYCNSRNPLELLMQLNEKFDVLSKALSTTLDQQRTLFPRLFFMDDANMIALQFACVNKVSDLNLYLNKLFDGIRDVSWSTLDDCKLSEVTAGNENAQRHVAPRERLDRREERLMGTNSLEPRTSSAPYPMAGRKEATNEKQPKIFGRTNSGSFLAALNVEPKHEYLSEVSQELLPLNFDPRISRWQVVGVIGASGEKMLFQETSVDEANLSGDPSLSPRLVAADALVSKLHRFLNSLLLRTSEELKHALVESRDKLLLATGLSLNLDQEQLEHMISHNSPQVVNLSVQLLWTASIEHLIDHAESSPGAALSQFLQDASKGLVSTIDALVDRGKTLRERKFRLLQRIAGIVVQFLSLRDATDMLVVATPNSFSRSSDFAWLKLPRFYWDRYDACSTCGECSECGCAWGPVECCWDRARQLVRQSRPGKRDSARMWAGVSAVAARPGRTSRVRRCRCLLT